MELRQLRHFLAVADEGHVTRAARGLHLQQSSLSSSIRSLERDLGADLFVRGPRGIELSETGRVLVPAARRALAAADEVRDAALGVRNLLRGRLLVGVLHDIGEIDLFGQLTRLHREHPAVEVHLRGGPAPRLAEAVGAGELDLAVLDRPVGSPGIVEHVLAAEHLVLAAPHGHPLAGRDPVDLIGLADHDVVDYHPESALRTSIDIACTRAGVRRRTVATAETLTHLVALVESGLGVAVVPPRAIHGRAVAAVELRPSIPRELTVVATPTPSPAASVLLGRLRGDAS